jgi:hypothetical protein
MMAERRRYTDRRSYLISAVQKRRKKIRRMAVELAGGKSRICGYERCSEALEFHHLLEGGKDFSISDKGHSRSWARVKTEVSKCVLLCANCHREIHSGRISLS